MKLFTILSLLAFSLSGFAQLPFDSTKNTKNYISFISGFRSKNGPGGWTQSTQDINGNTTFKRVESTFGAGIPFTICYGRYINRQSGLEFGLTYKVGKSKDIENVYYQELNELTITQKYFERSNEFQFSALFFTESKIEKFSLLLKAGPILSLGKNSIETEESYLFDNGARGNGTFLRESSYKPGIGLFTMLGFKIPLDQKISFIGGLSCIYLNRVWDGSVLTKAVINGENTLPNTPQSEVIVQPVDELNTSTPFDPDKPSNALRYKATYSSIGFCLGIQSHF